LKTNKIKTAVNIFEGTNKNFMDGGFQALKVTGSTGTVISPTMVCHFDVVGASCSKDPKDL